jgi:hypothetical protein
MPSIVSGNHDPSMTGGKGKMTIELPMTLDEIRSYQREQDQISNARVVVLRLSGRKRGSFNRTMAALAARGVNLAQISLDSLKQEVLFCCVARPRI